MLSRRNGVLAGLFVVGLAVGLLMKALWIGYNPQARMVITPTVAATPVFTPTPTPVSPPIYPTPATLALARRAVLRTYRPERPRFDLLRYTIQSGDTAWAIAQKYGLRMESILWGNEGMSADAGSLRVGQVINILPEDGVLHTVQEEETWETIEIQHGVAREKIIEYPGNPFDETLSEELVVGQKLIVPGGRNPIVWLDPGPQVEAGKGRQSTGFYSGALVNRGTGVYILPVSPVRITQPYWEGHPALDFDTVTGQPVYAADSGTVIYSGWSQSGYGNLIIVDHGTGYWTYYAHNDVNMVSAGQGVVQGQQIARSGNTGRSSGDHLDFRIRVAGGAFIDPTPLLPLP